MLVWSPAWSVVWPAIAVADHSALSASLVGWMSSCASLPSKNNSTLIFNFEDSGVFGQRSLAAIRLIVAVETSTPRASSAWVMPQSFRACLSVSSRIVAFMVHVKSSSKPIAWRSLCRPVRCLSWSGASLGIRYTDRYSNSASSLPTRTIGLRPLRRTGMSTSASPGSCEPLFLVLARTCLIPRPAIPVASMPARCPASSATSA